MSRSAVRVRKRSQTPLKAANGLPGWSRVLRNSLCVILHNIYHFSQLLQKTAYHQLLQDIFHSASPCCGAGCDTNAHFATHVTHQPLARISWAFAGRCTRFFQATLGNKRTTPVGMRSTPHLSVQGRRQLRRTFLRRGWFDLSGFDRACRLRGLPWARDCAEPAACRPG